MGDVWGGNPLSGENGGYAQPGGPGGTGPPSGENNQQAWGGSPPSGETGQTAWGGNPPSGEQAPTIGYPGGGSLPLPLAPQQQGFAYPGGPQAPQSGSAPYWQNPPAPQAVTLQQIMQQYFGGGQQQGAWGGNPPSGDTSGQAQGLQGLLARAQPMSGIVGRPGTDGSGGIDPTTGLPAGGIGGQPQPGQPADPGGMTGQFPTSLIQSLMQPQYLQNPALMQGALVQAMQQNPAQMQAFLAQAAQMNPAQMQAFMSPAASGQASMFDLGALGAGWQNPGGVNPAGSVQGAQSNAPTQLSQGLINSLSPQSSIDQIMAGFAPQAQRSERNLQQTLADFGVGGGQAVQADQQLQGQLSASIAPALAQAIQSAQFNQLGAGEFGINSGLQQSLSNAGFGQQAGLANQGTALQQNLMGAQIGAQNKGQFNNALASALGINVGNQQQMGLANLGNQQQTNFSNQNAANSAASQNAGFAQGAGQFNAGNAQQSALSNQAAMLQAALTNAGFRQNSGQFNVANALQAALANQGSTNQAGQYNAQATNATNAANVGQFNSSQAQMLQQLLQSYFTQMGINSGVVGAGQNAGNQQAINYGGTITTSNPFGDIMSALAQGAGAYYGAKH